MSGFSKRSVDNYIRNRIKYWIYDLGRHAHLYLEDELKLSTNTKDDLTDEDKTKIKEFQSVVTKDVIVTGGCFTSMLQGETPNDLDIYLRTNHTAELIARFNVNRMIEKGDLKETMHVHQIDVRPRPEDEGIQILVRSQGVASDAINTDDYKYFEAYPEDQTDEFFKEYKKKLRKAQLENEKYVVSFLTSNAITLNNGLQIIVRFTGTPEQIHANFDYIHTTNYWTWEEGVVYNEKALAATFEKRLYYFGSRFPVASIFRMRKFVERGWRISAGEMLKICYDISHLNLDCVHTLKEQSIGMDSAYFNDVIQILRKNSAKNIDRTYLFSVIDLVFQMIDKQDDFLDAKAEEDTPGESDNQLDLSSNEIPY